MTTDYVADVSLVICTYTEARWNSLVAAVESLRCQTLSPLEIIVVVDHNTHLLKCVQELLPGVIATANSNARGLSGARNQGITLARGTLVAFLDDDAVAESNWLLHLCQHCTEPTVMGVGGYAEPLWADRKPGWFPQEFYWVVGCSYKGLPDTLSEVRNLYGGCTCFKKQVLEDIGGFREDIGRIGTYPAGGEETELCIRVHQRWPDKTLLYNPQARILHYVPPSRASWHYFCTRCYAEGKSKAIITTYVGISMSLSEEKSYIYHTLLRSILYEIGNVFISFDCRGLFRAGAIVVGLCVTTTGYCAGIVSRYKRTSTNALSPYDVSSLNGSARICNEEREN